MTTEARAERASYVTGRRRGAAAGVALLLLVSGCSSGNDSTATDDDGSVAGNDEADDEVGPAPNGGGGTALDSLSDEEMCDLLSPETIEQELDTTVETTEPPEHATGPSCSYSTSDSEFSLRTSVMPEMGMESSQSDQERLDRVFTDLMDDAQPVVEYEEIEDLGAAAGYGSNPTLGGGGGRDGAANRVLAVVFHTGNERALLEITHMGRDLERDEAVPLAEELLPNLEEALR